MSAFATPLILDYLSLEDISAFSAVSRTYHHDVTTYWDTRSLEITDATIAPDTPESQIYMCTTPDPSSAGIYIPPRIRRLKIPARLHVPYCVKLSNVECLYLTCTGIKNNGTLRASNLYRAQPDKDLGTIIYTGDLSRLRRLHFNSNIFVAIRPFPVLDYVSISGLTYTPFQFGGTALSNIQRLDINIPNLSNFGVIVPHISITTMREFTLFFDAESKDCTEVRVICPNKVRLLARNNIAIRRLIIDAPKVQFLEEPIQIGELHVQSHLWWQFRNYNPKLLPSNRSACILS